MCVRTPFARTGSLTTTVSTLQGQGGMHKGKKIKKIKKYTAFFFPIYSFKVEVKKSVQGEETYFAKKLLLLSSDGTAVEAFP